MTFKLKVVKNDLLWEAEGIATNVFKMEESFHISAPNVPALLRAVASHVEKISTKNKKPYREIRFNDRGY